MVVVISIWGIKSYGGKATDKLKTQAKAAYPQSYQNYFELAKWINRNAPANSVTCCRKGNLFYLFSKKYVTGYKNTLNTEDQIEFLKSKDVDYVVLEQLGYSSTGRYLYPAIQKYPEKFEIIQHLKDPDTYLMKFHPDLGYWGEWKDGKRDGKGTFTWPNNNKFVGEWKDNLRNGKGILYLADGNQLEGTWVNDKLEGHVTVKNKDGIILEESIYKNNVQERIIYPKN